MTVALCLGGGSSVVEEWQAALDLFKPDLVVACNDVMAIWPGRLDACVTLHPEKLAGWREQRLANGYPEAERYLVHGDYVPDWMELIEFRFPGQNNSGSSGLFTLKAALIDLGADRAVLCGVPLARTAHFFDNEAWEAANGYRAVWESLRLEYKHRIRSMSGWTAHHFGSPTLEWMATGSVEADHPQPLKEPVMSSKLTKIAYEPHPVSVERKRELNKAGFKIMDIRFKPADAKAEKPVKDKDPDGGGNDGGNDDIKALRAEYEQVVGRKVYNGWDIDTLRAKIEEAKAGQ